MTCRICKRHAEGEYCEFHELSYRNIKRQYDVWKDALALSWKGFLSEIIANPYTGLWAREVAEQLSKNRVERDQEAN